jgi:hypothetical protein
MRHVALLPVGAKHWGAGLWWKAPAEIQPPLLCLGARAVPSKLAGERTAARGGET